MSHSTISSEVNNSVCEAYGCYAKATTEISVKVGELGTISLLLCKECVNRFTEKRGPDS
jgi:hypothetical protein